MPFRRSGRGRLDAVLVDVDASELVWPRDNGRVCLDLVATIGERWGRRFERLRSPADLHRWLGESGLIEQGTAVDRGHLGQVHQLRAAVYAALEAAVDDRPLPRWACDVLNETATRAVRVPEIDRRRRIRWRSSTPVDAALSWVATDAMDLIASPEVGRVRECAAADCSRIFLDQSRAGRRQWCSMRTCGNRAKVRRHRENAGGRPTGATADRPGAVGQDRPITSSIEGSEPSSMTGSTAW